MKIPILVTGGAGFIGSHACKLLDAEGFLPIVYDNMSHGHPWAVRWGPLEQGDLLDRDRLRAVLRKYRPQAILHFAAKISVGESMQDPLAYYETNLMGSLNLIAIAREERVERFIFSSTAALYGAPENLPLQETDLIQPASVYGRTKWAVEQILQDASRAHDLHYISLRYFNAAGSDLEGELGEEHHPETHLIPLILEVANGLRQEISIYGDDYPTRDGTCIRDYIHVTDLAAAHVLALKRLLEKPASDVFNLGFQEGHSVKEVIACAEKITGHVIPTRITGRRDGDACFLVANNSRALQQLGWRPQHSDLETIIKSAWMWKKQFRSQYVTDSRG